MTRPDAILFDLWGTLLHSVEFDPRKGHSAVLAQCDNPHRVPLDEVMDLGRRIVTSTIPREEDSALEYTQAALLKTVADAFDLRPRVSLEESEWIFWKAALEVSVVEGVSELLPGLESLGLPMGVISNSSFAGPTLERELEAHHLRRYFRFVISSADYGLRKPDPLIFEVALRRLGLEAGRVWFAGDNVGYDVVGARQAGLFPVAFNPRTRIPETVGEHAVISEWSQLAALIDEAEPR